MTLWIEQNMFRFAKNVSDANEPQKRKRKQILYSDLSFVNTLDIQIIFKSGKICKVENVMQALEEAAEIGREA